MLLGLASDKLIWLDPHETVPVGPTLMGWKAFSEPAATRSTVPIGDGDKVRLPARLISPENAVTSSVGGSRLKTASKGLILVSISPNHGAEEEKSDWLPFDNWSA